MTDFWAHLGPWLIMAVALPAWVGLSLWLIPSDRWAEKVIGDWADAEGLKVASIDDPRGFDRFRTSSLSRVYRIRVRDGGGRERRCKVVVGRLLVRPTFRNIRITWIEAR